ncbi:MAG: efflux RND transporter periplasmic adaptor subunit [Candidatus Eisenbacteria sp.]|nr:efflux RND transporter periplasmic adaptor subunit [Candidatus Eisenbacteria bacterium]
MKPRIVLCATALCLLFAGCGNSGGNPGEDGEATGVPVEIVTLRSQTAELRLERVGVLRGSAEVDVVPKVAGRIQGVRAVRGQRVERGEVLAVIEQADYLDGLRQAEAGMAVAEANRKQAELNVERQRSLFEEGIASDAVFEAAESAYQVASAGVRQAKAAVKMAERQVGDTRIISPLDGFVAERMVEVGTFVSPPVAAYNVVALDPMEIRVMVTDRDIAQVHRGAKVDISVAAFPGRCFAGRVTEVPMAADRTCGSFAVTVAVPNPDGNLRDGMTVTAAIRIGQRESAIVVPEDVLIERGGQWYAYVVNDTTAESRRVTLGDPVAGGVIVEEGLRDGEKLVVKGQAYLDNGTPVRIGEVGP